MNPFAHTLALGLLSNTMLPIALDRPRDRSVPKTKSKTEHKKAAAKRARRKNR